MRDFRGLRVWHLAKDFAVDVGKMLPASACRSLPDFRGQLMRASLSISANIAEGCGMRSQAEYRRYLERALGSLLEVENYLEVARSAEILAVDRYRLLANRADVLRRMMISLMKRVAESEG